MRKQFAKLTGVLTVYGIDSRRLSEIIGKNRDTARRRLREPSSFSLEELAAINAAGVPAADIREAITF